MNCRQCGISKELAEFCKGKNICKPCKRLKNQLDRMEKQVESLKYTMALRKQNVRENLERNK